MALPAPSIWLAGSRCSRRNGFRRRKSGSPSPPAGARSCVWTGASRSLLGRCPIWAASTGSWDSRCSERPIGFIDTSVGNGKTAKRIAQNLGGNAEQQVAAGKNVEVRKSLQKWSNQTFAGLAVAILRTIRCWKVLLLQPQDGSSMD